MIITTKRRDVDSSIYDYIASLQAERDGLLETDSRQHRLNKQIELLQDALLMYHFIYFGHGLTDSEREIREIEIIEDFRSRDLDIVLVSR